MSEIVVDPQIEDSTHHIALTDHAGRTIGLIAVDTRGKPDPRSIERDQYRGSNIVSKPAGGRWDERRPPYVAVEQSDWSGGRGQEDFERNRTKFADSGFMWTVEEGRMTPAPLALLSSGYRKMTYSLPSSSMVFVPLMGGNVRMFRKFQVDAEHVAGEAMLIIRRVGKPAALAIELRADSTGDPGALMDDAQFTWNWWPPGIDPPAFAESQYKYIEDRLSEVCKITLEDGDTLAVSTDYWIGVVANAGDNDENHWEIGCSSAAYQTKVSEDGATWANSQYGMYFLVGELSKTATRHFFHYKRGFYMVEAYDDGTAPKLYINGVRGVAKGAGQSVTVLENTDSIFGANNSQKGLVVAFTNGPGEGQHRRVLSNTATQVVPEIEFDVAATTLLTEFVILGGSVWTEITGHGITNPPTARPEIVNDVVYFPQGDATNVRRLNWYNNAGVWTLRTADDGTNKAVVIRAGKIQDTQILQVLLARDSDANGDTSVARADAKKWGTTLTPRAPVPIGDNHAFINEMFFHDGLPWVFKEDSLYAILNDQPDLILGELAHVRSRLNGIAVTAMTPNMYYSILPGIQQFFGKVQTNMGPNKGEWRVPEDRRGFYSALQTTGRWLFAASDGNNIRGAFRAAGGYADVSVYNGAGWHNVYRGPRGERIRSLAYQVIPGEPSKLWIGLDRMVVCLQFPEDQDGIVAPFHYESYCETSWISDNLVDVDKYWANMRLFAEGLGDFCRIEIDYMVDDDVDWTPFPYAFIVSPAQKFPVGEGQVAGKRVRFRLRLYTTSLGVRAVVKSVVPDYIGRYPYGYVISGKFLVEAEEGEAMEDLQGNEGTLTAEDIMLFLERAKNDPIPLRMKCVLPEFTDILVLPEQIPLRVESLAIGESRKAILFLRMYEA